MAAAVRLAGLPVALRAVLAVACLVAGPGCEPVRGDPVLKDFTCEMQLVAPPGVMKLSGPPMKLSARFTNRGKQAWPGWRGDGSRTRNIHVGARWFGPVVADAMQPIPIFEDLKPGETVTVEFEAKPPPAAGQYTLRVEPVQPNVSWFGDAGSKCVVLYPVTVSP